MRGEDCGVFPYFFTFSGCLPLSRRLRGIHRLRATIDITVASHSPGVQLSACRLVSEGRRACLTRTRRQTSTTSRPRIENAKDRRLGTGCSPWPSGWRDSGPSVEGTGADHFTWSRPRTRRQRLEPPPRRGAPPLPRKKLWGGHREGRSRLRCCRRRIPLPGRFARTQTTSGPFPIRTWRI